MLTLLVVSILVFAAHRAAARATPAGAILGRNATPENLAEVRELMGLDRPAPERYLDWLGGLLTGDLGNSSAGYAQGGELRSGTRSRDRSGNSFDPRRDHRADDGADLALPRGGRRAARGPAGGPRDLC